MKRYDFYCSYDVGGPAEADEMIAGSYVLFTDAETYAANLVDIERKRILIAIRNLCITNNVLLDQITNIVEGKF